MVSRSIRLFSSLLFVSCTAPLAVAQSQLWIKQFGSTHIDHAYAAAADGNGGVFVGGPTVGALAGPAMDVDAWLSRTDATGGRVWTLQFGTPGVDALFAATSDGAGGVLSAGYTDGALAGTSAGSYDAWIARHDGTGQLIWSTQLGSAGLDFAYAITSDGAGGAFLGGNTTGAFGGPHAGNDDAWVAHCDPAGNVQWVRQLGTAVADKVKGAASDGAGGVFVCGETSGSLAGPAAGTVDAWLARYDANGVLLWSRQLGTLEHDNALAAASDGAGGVFVVGSTLGSLGGPNQGNFDAWAARYDGAGTQQWITQFGNPVADWAASAVVDSCGDLVVTGHCAPPLGAGGGADAMIARLDGSGSLLSSQTLGLPNLDDKAWTTASDGAGGLFIAGDTFGSLAGTYQGWGDVWIARYGTCSSVTTYCTASGTSITGCEAAIAAIGSPALTTPGGFSISSGNVPGGKPGICIFGGNGAASLPFGTLGGQLCVQGPFFRTAPKSSGGTSGACDGALEFAMQDLINASPALLPGTEIHAQIWARDNNADGFLLSDGLRFTVGP